MEHIKKAGLFLGLSICIYICYLTSAVYHEKLLKHPYSNFETGEKRYFQSPLLFCIFPQMIATIIGRMILTVEGSTKALPWKNCMATGLLINICVITYNLAVVEASFPAIVMAKSSSLLSVIIVGVFCSRVKDSKLRLSQKKLLIGILATLGIIFFNFFKKQEKEGNDHSISIFSMGSLYLLISLIGDGFLPDLQAQIKSEYKPTAIELYYAINKSTFLIGLILSVLTSQIHNILDFIYNYEGFAGDLMGVSVLNAVGQLFIYRMINQFRQHIPAFVIAFRKCLTVIINIVWFHHEINTYQMVGVVFVSIAVLWEVWSNYQEGLKKSEQSAPKDDELANISKSIDDRMESKPLK